MLRAAALVLAISSVAAIAEEPGETAACVTIDLSKSSTYQTNEEWHFDMTFQVPQWVPKMRVSIAFGESVTISHVYQGANVFDQYYYYGQVDDSTLVVELDETPHQAGSEFVVMGTGSNNLNPGISCRCAPLLCGPAAC
eukprot:Transcript_14622.p2 GENE.Transcript_14622~~Transcript_14622.p2  ORF type:complete len:160 (-),score=49.92 Transcript_14622:1137-1553(-)